jgi:hypothetical protein
LRIVAETSHVPTLQCKPSGNWMVSVRPI